jgi:hypothetical protein
MAMARVEEPDKDLGGFEKPLHRVGHEFVFSATIFTVGDGEKTLFGEVMDLSIQAKRHRPSYF